MIRKNKAENVSFEENDATWLGNNLYRLMLIVSVVWFAIVLIYITQFFGWSNLFLMMPDEFGGFLAGVTLPLAIIWVGMAYVDRSSAFKREAKFLRAYMNQMVFPEEGGSATAKAMSEAIRSQVAELQEVTKLAMSQTTTIKKELDERVDDFASLVRVLDNYSTKSIVELTNGVKTLTQSFDGVTDKAFKTTRDLSGCIKEFSEIATHLQTDINSIVDNLLPGMHEIKNSADIIQTVAESSSRQIIEASESLKEYGNSSEENFNRVFDNLQKQSKYLEDVSEKAIADTKAVGEAFAAVSTDIDELIVTRSLQAAEHAKNLDGSLHDVYKKIAEHSNLFSDEAEKIIAQTALVEENLSVQANEIRNIAETVADSLGKAEASLNSGFDNLEERSTSAVENIREVVDTVKVKTENLITFTDVAHKKLEECSDTIVARHQELQNINGKVQTSLDGVMSRMGEEISGIENSLDDIIARFNQVNDAISQQAEKLNESGNIVLVQSRQTETSLAEQHNYISNSLSKVEEFKSELKRQVEELSGAAGRIAEEASTAVERLKEQLAASVEASSEVVEKTHIINSSMEAETKRLDETTVRTLEKVADLQDVIAAQNDRLNNLIGKVDERAGQIASTLEKHADAVDEATAGFDNQFNKIVTTFETQSALFTSVAENTAEVSETIKDQIASIDENADALFAKIENLEEKVEERASAAADKSNLAVDRLSEIDKEIAARIEQLDSDITDVLSRQQKITDSLKSGVNEFGKVIDQARDQADDVVASISENVGVLKAVHDEFGMEVEGFINRADSHINAVNGAVEQIRNQGAVMGENFDGLAEGIRNQTTEMGSVFDGLAEGIRNQTAEMGNAFTGMANGVRNQTAEMGDVFEGLAKGIDNKTAEMGNAFDSMAEMVRNRQIEASERFSTLLEQIRIQNEAINDNFIRQREDLTDAVNLVTAQTRLGEAAISNQYKCLMDASDDVAVKMNSLSEQFRGEVGELCNNAARLSEEVSAMGDRLLAMGGHMETSTKNSIADIEQVNLAMSQCSQGLNSATDNAAANMDRIVKEYQNCLSGFDTVTAQTNNSLNEVGVQLAAQSEKMVHISEETKSLVDYFNGLMNGASDQLIEKANVAHDQIRGLGESLKALSKQMEDSTGASSQYFADSGDRLRSTIVEIMANAERISGEIKSSSETFLQQSETLNKTADDTLNRVNEVMGGFSFSLEDFQSKSNDIVANTESFNAMIKKQIELLDIGAKQAGSELADIEKRYRELKVENFLKNATSIIEKLETLAVDINMIFNPETQDKLWQKYYEGDTDIFVRHLSRTMSRKQVVAIKDEFEKNPEFRKMVKSYMGEFEELVNRARACEKSGILLSVISGADIGKIYYVIARAMDKLN